MRDSPQAEVAPRACFDVLRLMRDRRRVNYGPRSAIGFRRCRDVNRPGVRALKRALNGPYEKVEKNGQALSACNSRSAASRRPSK